MNRRSLQYMILCCCSLAGCLLPATAPWINRSRISVVFVNRRSSPTRAAPNSSRHFGHPPRARKFLIEIGESYVPEDMNLDIRVTDIDLAGNFEPWHGPQSDQVRITRGLYPPRIALEFRVVDSAVKWSERQTGDDRPQLSIADLLSDG